MNNPWLKISPSDYENHMTAVGQAQVLNKLVKDYLHKYRPKSFALLGCSTGNGLEHIGDETKDVYAIDINPEYLNMLEKNFGQQINKLQILNLDIQKDALPFKNIELFFVGLVLEYVEIKETLHKIIKTLKHQANLVIVIQRNKNSAFVSDTKYKSLEKLTKISNEVDEIKMDQIIRSQNMDLIERKEIVMNPDKSFVVFNYQLIKTK